ncbi:hypothetical protein [Streptomyces sp. NPDC126499]|uniref:hypothetical protein n=1 Tax=Streptomyces sp. NPDC126499 TaxID=3155314 RepID=UPI00387E8CF7
MDAASVLPALAAVPAGALTGTDMATVVELADPLDPQAVLTRLRAVAAAPGPLALYLAGQLQLDRRQRLPHLALARSTPTTLRYTGLPWHWLATELAPRRPGTTTVVADLAADPELWQRLAADPGALGLGPAVPLFARLVPFPRRGALTTPDYLRHFATLWRTGARPPLPLLHAEAAAAAAQSAPQTQAILLSPPAPQPSPATPPHPSPPSPPAASVLPLESPPTRRLGTAPPPRALGETPVPVGSPGATGAIGAPVGTRPDPRAAGGAVEAVLEGAVRPATPAARPGGGAVEAEAEHVVPPAHAAGRAVEAVAEHVVPPAHAAGRAVEAVAEHAVRPASSAQPAGRAVEPGAVAEIGPADGPVVVSAETPVREAPLKAEGEPVAADSVAAAGIDDGPRHAADGADAPSPTGASAADAAVGSEPVAGTSVAAEGVPPSGHDGPPPVAAGSDAPSPNELRGQAAKSVPANVAEPDGPTGTAPARHATGSASPTDGLTTTAAGPGADRSSGTGPALVTRDTPVSGAGGKPADLPADRAVEDAPAPPSGAPGRGPAEAAASAAAEPRPAAPSATGAEVVRPRPDEATGVSASSTAAPSRPDPAGAAGAVAPREVVRAGALQAAPRGAGDGTSVPGSRRTSTQSDRGTAPVAPAPTPSRNAAASAAPRAVGRAEAPQAAPRGASESPVSAGSGPSPSPSGSGTGPVAPAPTPPGSSTAPAAPPEVPTGSSPALSGNATAPGAPAPIPPRPTHAPGVPQPGVPQLEASRHAAELDPHPAILAAAMAGRHGEAAAMAAAWESDALRRYGPRSGEAVHWVEVRADLARLAGEPARSCELWIAAAQARLGMRQGPDEPDVEGAVDRAHHQWEQIKDPARARALGPALVELRRTVPGRHAGALAALQRRMGG